MNNLVILNLAYYTRWRPRDVLEITSTFLSRKYDGSLLTRKYVSRNYSAQEICLVENIQYMTDGNAVNGITKRHIYDLPLIECLDSYLQG